jgi:hypothetical protein
MGRKIYIRLVSYYVECRKIDGGRGRGVGLLSPLLPFFMESETAGADPFLMITHVCKLFGLSAPYKSCQVMS